MVSEIEPQVLLLSNKFDYTTDHIAYQLNELGVTYVRLNRDQFSEMSLELSSYPPYLRGENSSFRFSINQENLRSVYFRAPVFLRDNYQPRLTPDEQFSRSQWAAFIRSLTVFSQALWINHPSAVYSAEIKPYQLQVASLSGLKVPATIITNSSHCSEIEKFGSKLATKVLDSVVLRFGDQEGFIYTNISSRDDLKSGNITTAPIIVQEALVPKVDIRATIVGSSVFAAAITDSDGNGFDDDWRKKKSDLCYKQIDLPIEIQQKCIEVARRLNLVFGGMDLVLYDGDYYFIEVNPTGEWAWLLEQTKFPIDLEIARLLAAGKAR